MIYTIQGKNIHEKDGLTVDESSLFTGMETTKEIFLFHSQWNMTSS